MSVRRGSLRVALAIESNGPGGAENMLVNLATGLRSRGFTAIPVIPAVPPGSWLESRLREAGFTIETCTVTRPFDPAAFGGLCRTLLQCRIDVVHSHEFTMAVYGRAASWLARIPHVNTMHGGTGFARRTRRRRALGWSLRHSDARVAVSESAADFLAESCQIARGTIDVIPNGVEVPSGDRASAREELGLAPDELLVLAVGNLYPVKGHRTLIEAAARLDAIEVPWTVAIAGRGDEEPILRELIAAHGLHGRVRLLGLRRDVPDLLAAADVFVMPSLSEGLPLALLEAMSAGLPAIASAVGGIPAVVRHGETGLLVNPGDVDGLSSALGGLLQSREVRDRLGTRAAREIPGRYGLDRMVEAYIELYARVSSISSPA